MGGYEIPVQEAVLDFEDGPYEGAEVRCSLDISLDAYLAYQRFADEEPEGKELRELFHRFGEEVLIGWNIEEGGEPVPATGDGMVQRPITFMIAVLSGWLRAVSASPEELPPPDGASLAAASTATAESSASPKP